MRIVFFGTPDYIIPVLEKLHKYHEIVAVVTQSPKPMGRGKTLTYSAVDAWAFKKHIIRNFDYVDLPEADMGVCASFGMIIPKIILDHFKYGILNIHPSLLPMFRGSSPIQATLISGINPTGVSIIRMVKELDAGPILTQFEEDVLKDDTNETLRARLFEKSADVLLDMIPAYIEGKIKYKPQDETKVVTTKMIKREDGFVDLYKDNHELIWRKFRAYSPWPGIWTMINDKQSLPLKNKRLKILKCRFEDNKLILDEVQPESKNPTTWNIFRKTYGLNDL
ncbi:MAG: Methionyl-tRNA formyltransferase [uncultured bacterium]|nr:MAG: Methionyl-tRNA formyltransferase [uncultured bacterium]